MRIAIVSYRLAGGGAERVASLWAKGFSRRGHSVSVFVQKNDTEDNNYPLPKEVDVITFGPKWKPLKLRYLLLKFHFYRRTVWDNLKNRIEDFRPDVVIGILAPYAWNVRQMLPDSSFLIVNTDHNSYERPNDAPLTKQEIIEKFEHNKYFDVVTVLTQRDKDILGNDFSNVYVLPNPITFDPVKNVPAKKNTILACGRLDVYYVKGFDLLIKAWSRVCKRFPDWTLELAGTGKKKSIEYINNLVASEHIENQFRLLGFCKDMKRLYQTSSIFVLSSRYEGFGMVLTEAMSQGCACIAADFNGRQREIIENDYQGLVCPNNDIEALAHAIEKMISDKEYRETCQRNAIIRSHHYSLDNIMDRWEEIIDKNVTIIKA